VYEILLIFFNFVSDFFIFLFFYVIFTVIIFLMFHVCCEYFSSTKMKKMKSTYAKRETISIILFF